MWTLIVGAGVIVFYEITFETAVRISSARLQVRKTVMPLFFYGPSPSINTGAGRWLQICEAATAYLAYGTRDNIQKHLLL